MKQLTKEEINNLPLLEFTGEVVLVTDVAHAVRAAAELQSAKILGFDTETRPSFRTGESYPVALLQLSTAEKAYLCRLSDHEILTAFIPILSDENITKVGVAIRDDLKALQKIKSFTPQGFVELADMATKHGFTHLGLRALAAGFLNKRLSKAAKLTNWERWPLTPSQISYAACDAYAGLLIYQALQQNH